MRNKEVKIQRYADDAMLMADSEDDLQTLLYQFNKIAKKFNMVISKSMTTSKIPIRCKLVVDDKIILQEGKVKYLEIVIFGYENVETEVRNQAAGAMRAAAHLNDVIWWNKHTRNEAKV